MLIQVKDFVEADLVMTTIHSFLERSRFNLSGRGAFGGGGMTAKQIGRKVYVKILGVRLNESKSYCGNHAGPCVHGHTTHRKGRWLEGLDWVAFDDMINDALDCVYFDGDAYSSVCNIRKGRKRRIDYYNYGERADAFDKFGQEYEDFCGRQAPQSEYVGGTPGIPTWRAKS